MIVPFNGKYRKFWKQWARFKPSTSTYDMFTARISNEPEYKRQVDTYIQSTLTASQQQRELEASLHFGAS